MSNEPITQCKTCRTSWDDCDILDGGECAACLRREVDRLKLANETLSRSHAEVVNSQGEEIRELRGRIVEGVESKRCPDCGGIHLTVTHPLCHCGLKIMPGILCPDVKARTAHDERTTDH